MPFDADISIPTPAAVEAAVSAMTLITPSSEAFNVVAAALDCNIATDDLLQKIALKTGLAVGGEAGLHFVREYLETLKSFSAGGHAERLALDALRLEYAWGLHLRVLSDGTLLSFGGSHWAEASLHDIRARLMCMALKTPELYGAALPAVTGALAIIRDIVPLGDAMTLAPPRQILPVRNGEIWFDAQGKVDLRIHRPETGCRYAMPVAYDPQAKAVEFEAMLTDIFSRAADPVAVIDHVLEVLGYAAQPVKDIATIGWLWGEGSNGKSTVLKILQGLVGPRQVYAGSLDALAGDRFVLPNLVGKLVFVEDDANDGDRLADGLLKRLAENKVIDARRVRSTHGTSFTSMVIPIIAANGAPRLDDVSHGMRRRLQVIPFDRQFSPDEWDLGLADRILDNELPGVLNLFIAGLQRLRERGRFAPPAECDAAKAALISAANPLAAFLEECTEPGDGKALWLTEIYDAFAAWQRGQGQKPTFSRRGLKARLISLGYHVRKSQGRPVIDGLRLVKIVA